MENQAQQQKEETTLQQSSKTSTQHNDEDYQSKLSKHEYWESNFELELKNFEQHGDDGEVWFGEDVQKKSVLYILSNYPVEENADKVHVLDVGMGNGAFLFKLAKKGYQNLKGIDYSEYSVRLSKKIQESQDYAQNVQFEYQNAFDHIEEAEYDIIHDKGTFDVIVMNPELSNDAYAEAIRFKLKKGGIFIITSCNCTSEELDSIYVKKGLFKKKDEIKGYKSFKFGGVVGQVVSTNVYTADFADDE
eukprot:403355419